MRPSGENDQTPPITIVGLSDTAVRESRERIRAAINNSSYFFPILKFAVNLAPADVRKEGESFDLPIGAQLLGNFWSEDTLLNMTHAYEAAFPFDAKPAIHAE